MDLWMQRWKGRLRRIETWEHTLPHANETASGSLLWEAGVGGAEASAGTTRRAGMAWEEGEVPGEGRVDC